MDSITVRVKTIDDTSFSLDVSKDLTVASFKQRLKVCRRVAAYSHAMAMHLRPTFPLLCARNLNLVCVPGRR
jgi:hypothetical protein